MSRRAWILGFLLTGAPVAAAQHPSKLFVGVEAGMASGSLPDADPAGLIGGRIRYRADDRWAFGAGFSRRVHDSGKTPVQSDILPIVAAAEYALRPGETWAPYAFAEAGYARSRRIVQSGERNSQKPAYGLGLGLRLKLGRFHDAALEAGHRRFPGASPFGHQVTETGAALVVSFAIPDDWIPIRPPQPLNIPDMDDPGARAAAVPLPDLQKRQAQIELDKVQQDIREHKIPPIHFETGQAILLQASFETLDIVGTILRRYPDFSVLITGHTDEVGEAEDNQILSLARAEVVRAYLLQNFGLPTDKLSAEGAGEAAPIADNGTEEGRSLNRRVEFTIQP